MKPVYRFYVIGIGGTGSLFVRDLARLIAGTDHSLVLIDGDIVEKKNVARQCFQKMDIGHNKARAMARKINSFYEIDCEAIDAYVTENELAREIGRYSIIPVIIGCVDNDATRKLLENTFRKQITAVYYDAANSAYSGNVYASIRYRGQQYGPCRSDIYELADDKKPTDRSCLDLITEGNLQYMVTNAKLANCLLEHCFNLLHDEMIITGVTRIDRFTEVHY